MCVGFWSLEHPDYALILCGNRDEFLARPTAPAAFHSFERDGLDDVTEGSVLSGRDLRAGGSWLGVSRSGRVAFLTNITEAVGQYTSSRGELVSSFLLPHAGSEQNIHEHLDHLIAENRSYAGFNLLLLSSKTGFAEKDDRPGKGTSQLSYEGAYVTNHGGGGDIFGRTFTETERHFGGLSNGIDGNGAESWPKVVEGITMFDQIVRSTASTEMGADSELVERLFNLLTWQGKQPPRDRSDLKNVIHVEPISVKGPLSDELSPNVNLYGTRLSTVILIRRDGEVLFIERDIWMLSHEGEAIKSDAKSQRVFRFRVAP